MKMDSSGKSKDKSKNKEEIALNQMRQTSQQTDIASTDSLTSPKPDSVSEKPVSKGFETQKSNSGYNSSNGSQNEEKTPLFMSVTDSTEPKLSAEKVENVSKQTILQIEEKESRNLQTIREHLAENQYQSIEIIWTENFGHTFKAFDSRNRRFVSVKVLELRKMTAFYKTKFLEQELVLLIALRHNSIIHIFDIFRNQDNIYVIMEFTGNESVLDWLINNGSMSETTAWKVFKKVLEAIDYMHSLKCAHRDLNLENILLTEGNEPKLFNFRFGIEVDDSNPLSETFCGCAPYSAPEILMRRPYDPFQTDIWSLGVCVYVMVNSGFPFPTMDLREMLRKQLNKEWDFKESVAASLSPNIKTMIRKMLEPVGSDRPTANVLMSDPWVLSHQSTQPTH